MQHNILSYVVKNRLQNKILRFKLNLHKFIIKNIMSYFKYFPARNL